ncbi:MAG TPA: primosomal protein N' [Longimicrobiales bacterium]|nr:primosomal protein N' [Longimicrobiales bacterium]
MSGGACLVEVALPLPIHRTFTYRLEGPAPPPGTRVLVPFRERERIGWVVGPAAGDRADGADRAPPELRAVLAVLDEQPSVTPEMLSLCRWIAEYYVAPLGIAIRSALPAVLCDASRDYVALAREPDGDLTPRERRLVGALCARPGPQHVRSLRAALGKRSIWPEIRALRARGIVTHTTVPPAGPAAKVRRVVRIARELGTLAEREEVFGRAGRQREAYELLEAAGREMELAHLVGGKGFSRGVVRGLEEKGLVAVVAEEELRDPFAALPVAPASALTPTPRQRDAIERLVRALDAPRPKPFLLHGITGSGKTLVYIQLLHAVLARGRSAIVLVPEIGLTPQTAARFRAHFGDQVAVLHSGLSEGERYDAWRSLRRGERRIAVGARSALFAPLGALGAIIVDEEHDGSYKQSEAPRYHARDLAIVRAQASGAVCVLGSATPSLESWANARAGKFERLALPERVGGGRLPEVRVLDLRARGEGAAARAHVAPGGVFSAELAAAVRARLARGEQVILLQNRRGYASFVQCRECGEVDRCENCSVSLTFHRVTRRLLCHHCRYELPAPERCARCGSRDLSFRGLGTEQVERVAAELFPEARIARMDVDTTSGKWAHHRILGRVERGEVDILLGTQMIAKGLDFPRVTLVGVINADVGIHLPDFRASERTFQLLAQVAGRAGRGGPGGQVLIQTALPDHYAVRAAVDHDYEAFAERELEERAKPGYPPWSRLVNVVLSSPEQRLAAAAAEDAVRFVRSWLERHEGGGAGVEVVGPAPCPIERLHGRWRWHFLLRSPSPRALGEAARALAEGHRLPAGDVRLALDRDPVALL